MRGVVCCALVVRPSEEADLFDFGSRVLIESFETVV